jgi:tetratricopeptide (TPR) repeat protein
MTLRLSFPLILVAAMVLPACSGARSAASGGLVGCPAPRAPMAAVRTTAPVAPTAEPEIADVRGQNPALDAAIAAYDEARFDEAATGFESVSTSGTPVQRRLALRLLGRTRLALGDASGATDALRRLVSTEPPIVRLNPDVEPLRLMEAFYDVRHATDGDYAVRTERGNTLAIADFTNGSVTDFQAMDPLRLGFAALMIDRLRGSTQLELVERVRLQWLLDELSLGAGEDAGRQAGQLLGADQVVFGTYIKSQNTLLLTARVVDVATGRIVLGQRVSGPADQFDALVGCLSDLVAQSVNADMPTASAEAPAESLDAVIAYARGLALEESEDYEAAAQQYQMALQLSPGYAPAEQRLTEGLAPYQMAANR